MGVRVSVKVDTKDLRDLESRWRSVAKMARANDPAARRAIELAAMDLVGNVRQAIHETINARSAFSVRTGALARSFRESWSVSGGTIRIAAESDLIYARIQDQGGTIFPKTRKHLAIPLMRLPVGKWPRDFPRGTLFRIKGGKVLYMRKGKGKLQPVYALAKSVTIHGKHYLARAARVSVPRTAEIFAEAINGRLRGRGN